jgi:V/A-type H+-transporting ATPase subunit I
MLRPERMSKVSVTGSKAVMDDVVEAAHGLHLVHLSKYNDSWDGFRNGDPAEGADAASEKLVTVRSLESILDVEPEDAGPSRIVTDEALEMELEEIRTEANRLDDERSELEDELREIQDRIDAMEPFVDLGIELDLLSGYDSLEVAVGEGKAAAVEAALAESDDVEAFETFTANGTVAVFAYPAGDAEGALEDALVGVDFARVEVPEGEGDPREHVEELTHHAEQLEGELTTVEESIEDLRLDAGGFLLAAEEKLTIEVQKAEAPLSFATTENAFVAEGWVPTERYGDFEAAIHDAVRDHAEVEELQRAAFGSNGEEKLRETVVDDSPDRTEERSATDEEGETEEPPTAIADGGGPVVMRDDDPPVVQDNPGPVRPFELLTKAVGRPNYTEFDPTIVLFLTFPVLFGFMIGDVGYGLVYSAIGYWVAKNFDSDAFVSFGQITIAAGLFTILFGILYGEVFGTHMFGEMFWHGVVGLEHAPLEKGLSPGSQWAQAWLIVTVLFGAVHLFVGYAFDFVEELEFHGFKAAMLETGSWMLALVGLWTFVFSRLYADSKPDLLFQTFGEAGREAYEPVVALGFTGLPEVVGWIGLGLTLFGFALLAIGPTYELAEFAQPFAHTLSYLRIAAVLLAKAGMAFAVNLLYFGAYEDEAGEYHFLIDHGPEYAAEHGELMFAGLSNSGVGVTAAGILVLIVGHLVVLALGVTSSGIQAARLEYFEFFSKFYDGEGTEYEPFGRKREYTANE